MSRNDLRIMSIIFELSKLLPDKLYISLVYYKHFKKFPNFTNPTTFSEKLQWLKLYDRDSSHTIMADKIAVKDYVRSIIGEEYIIPTYKIWESVDKIDINELPDKFILKCNHDSHSKIVCTDKSTFNLGAHKKTLHNCLNRNGYWYGREWPYKDIKPVVFAEKLLESPDGDLKDYKVMCFNGKAKLIELNYNRFLGELGEVIYDINWNKTSISQGYKSSQEFERPKNFELMIELSELLAKDLRHARVDWYNIDGQLYFGEITFFDGAGFVPFDNSEDDELIGSWLDLE